MSRRPGVLLPALLLAAPLAAQEAPEPAPETVTAERVLADAQKAYALPVRGAQAECPMPKPGGEIVVCARQDNSDRFRAASSSDLDPTGAGARGGVPHADVETGYPGVAVASGCFIPPCPPPMPVLIDLKAIPEAPPGSDADRIARGELAQ